jgi:hypothetical protein
MVISMWCVVYTRTQIPGRRIPGRTFSVIDLRRRIKGMFAFEEGEG